MITRRDLLCQCFADIIVLHIHALLRRDIAAALRLLLHRYALVIRSHNSIKASAAADVEIKEFKCEAYSKLRLTSFGSARSGAAHAAPCAHAGGVRRNPAKKFPKDAAIYPMVEVLSDGLLVSPLPSPSFSTEGSGLVISRFERGRFE